MSPTTFIFCLILFILAICISVYGVYNSIKNRVLPVGIIYGICLMLEIFIVGYVIYGFLV